MTPTRDATVPRNSIKRVKQGKHFAYYSNDTGKKITSPAEIKRINCLRVAPGYHDVVISANPNSKVQAFGYDARGRKQTTYHRSWIETQKAQKFADLANFNDTYRKINYDVDQALKGKITDPKEYIIRLIVKLCILCHLRIGNDKYAKEYESYGLTTLLSKHVTIKENKFAVFDFIGKKAVRNVATCSDPIAIKILTMLKKGKKPNDRLFSYTGEDGRVRSVDSMAVNAYLKKFDPNITSKDIRTYEANRLFILHFQSAVRKNMPQTDKEWKATIRETIKIVAERLHHTPAVCKNAYLASELVDGIENNPAYRMKILRQDRSS